MTGIEAERQMDLSSGCRLPIAAVPEVIFDVAASDVKIRVQIRELPKNLTRALRHNIGKDI